MMTTIRSMTVAGLGLWGGLASISCVQESTYLIDDHCANQHGDAWCSERYGGLRGYCVLGGCGPTEGRDGCVAELPTNECYSPCGASMTVDDDASCLASGSSGSSDTGDTGGSTTSEDSTGTEESGTSTTGPMPCMGDEDCTDEAAPFCDPAGECVDCGQLADGSAACAEADPGLPVCEAGACVACTETDIGACQGATPICDVETNTCVPCTEHGQCGEAACNLFTGACLPMDAVVHVGAGQDFSSITAAVSSFAAGAEGTIIVHAGASYDEAVTVNGGRVLAFLAEQIGVGVQPPRWIRSGGASPQLTVSNATVLMDGIQVSGNASSTNPGVLVNGGQAWLDRSRVVTNLGGGIVALSATELVLRNCFVGGGTTGEHAIAIDGSTASISYTTAGVGFDNFEDVFAVYCGGAVDVTIRNSLFVSIDNAPGEVSCSTASVSNSASETLIPGSGNVDLPDVGMMWFADLDTGDFHLSTVPVAITTAAQWDDGDPATDIDGQPRPRTDGASDVAGADVP